MGTFLPLWGPQGSPSGGGGVKSVQIARWTQLWRLHIPNGLQRHRKTTIFPPASAQIESGHAESANDSKSNSRERLLRRLASTRVQNEENSAHIARRALLFDAPCMKFALPMRVPKGQESTQLAKQALVFNTIAPVFLHNLFSTTYCFEAVWQTHVKYNRTASSAMAIRRDFDGNQKCYDSHPFIFRLLE